MPKPIGDIENNTQRKSIIVVSFVFVYIALSVTIIGVNCWLCLCAIKDDIVFEFKDVFGYIKDAWRGE